MEKFNNTFKVVPNKCDKKCCKYKKIFISILFVRIEKGDLETVKELMNHGVDVIDQQKEKLTPLHVAAKFGHDSIINFLIENGAFINSTIKGSPLNGFTPLHLAVLHNHLNSAKLLLEKGASVSSKIYYICRPIHLAVNNNNVEMVGLLCHYGADVNDRFPNSFFKTFNHGKHWSLWEGHNLPLLHYAILRESEPMINFLLSLKADIHAKTKLGKTTLMQAVEINSVPLVNFLVNLCHVNVNDRDKFGQPVLHFTVVNGNRKSSMYSKQETVNYPNKLRIIKILMDEGVDVNAQFPEDTSRSSVIHYMIKYGFCDGVKIILNSPEFNFNEIDVKSFASAHIFRIRLAPDLERDFYYMTFLKRQFEMIIYHIITKAIDLQSLGLLVNKNLILKQPFHPWITIQEHTERIDSWRARLSEQINYAKNKKIEGRNISVWELLTCNRIKLLELMSNEIIRNFDPTQDQELLQTYDYCNLLIKRLNWAKGKKICLDEATEVLSTVLIDHLPYDCCKKIAMWMVIDN